MLSTYSSPLVATITAAKNKVSHIKLISSHSKEQLTLLNLESNIIYFLYWLERWKTLEDFPFQLSSFLVRAAKTFHSLRPAWSLPPCWAPRPRRPTSTPCFQLSDNSSSTTSATSLFLTVRQFLVDMKRQSRAWPIKIQPSWVASLRTLSQIFIDIRR